MEIAAGAVFDTPAESGCVATTAPDPTGAFLATAPDGVECQYTVAMVCGYGHPDHGRVPHTCTAPAECDRPGCYWTVPGRTHLH